MRRQRDRACAERRPDPNLDRGIALAWQARPTIVQTLRLQNPGMRVGDTLRLESVLKMWAPTCEHRAYRLRARHRGNLKTEAPFILCAAYAMRERWHRASMPWPRSEESLVTRGPLHDPGAPLLDPAVWVPAELTVRAR